MEKNNNNDLSASDLLKKLKANIAESDEKSAEQDSAKKYKFRRSGRTVSPVTEDEIHSQMPENASDDVFVSPVPKSDIEDLDVDELMRRYLPDDDYKRFSENKDNESSDELVKNLSEIETIFSDDENACDSGNNGDTTSFPSMSDGSEKLYTAPDSELFDDLSEGGKVCDIPVGESKEKEEDTLVAPKRNIPGLLTPEQLIAMSKGGDTSAVIPASEEEQAPAVAVDNSGTLEIDKLIRSGKDDSAENPEAEEMTESSASSEYSEGSETQVLPDVEKKMPVTGSQLAFNFDTAPMPDISSPEYSESESKISAEDTAIIPENDISGMSDTVIIDDPSALGDGSGLDKTDANIMYAFGMEDELNEAFGKEYADKLRSENENADSIEPEKQIKEKPSNEKVIKEFISPTETKEIIENYKNEYGKVSLKMIGIAVITALLFLYENIGIFGGRLSDVFNPQYFPVVNVMVGLQILLIGFAVMYKNVISGAIGLINKKPTPDSILPLLLVISVIYSICACFFTPGLMFRTHFFPASLCLLLSAVGNRLDLHREIMTFNIVSSKRGKFALEKLDLDEAELETRAFDGFLPKQPDIFKINKTSFVDGYFRRTKAYPSGKAVIGAVIPISLVLTLITFFICLFTSKSGDRSVQTAYLLFSLSLPGAMFFTYCLPSFKASKNCYSDKSAFIGETAFDEYTSAASISFDDREVFPTGGVKLRSVKVFGSGRIDTVIYDMASIYSILGGPLSDVLNVATADIGHSEDSEVLKIDNNGVEALVDGHHLYAGKADYIRRNGYVPVSDPDDEDIEETGDISIMYLVCDDELIAKLYVRYRIDPEFESMLKTLYKSGICVGIKTVDPNINDDMLSTRIKLAKYPVRVLKYSDVADTKHGQERTDSGIVSRKSAKALLRTFTVCDKVKHIIRTNIALNFIAMLIGILITVAVVTLGTVSSVGSVYVGLYQIFWLIPMYLMSKFMLI